MAAETLARIDELLEATLAPGVARTLSDRDVMFLARLRLRRRTLGDGMLRTMKVQELERLAWMVKEA